MTCAKIKHVLSLGSLPVGVPSGVGEGSPLLLSPAQASRVGCVGSRPSLAADLSCLCPQDLREKNWKAMEALSSAERACEEKLRSLTQAKVSVPHMQTPLLVKIRSAATVWFSKPHKTHKPRAEQPWPRSLRDPCQGVPQRSMPGGPSEIHARGPLGDPCQGPLGDPCQGAPWRSVPGAPRRSVPAGPSVIVPGGPSEICARRPLGDARQGAPQRCVPGGPEASGQCALCACIVPLTLLLLLLHFSLR